VGVPNLFVCDGSVMPTQGSANPALTIMALASRLGQRLAAKRVDPTRGGGRDVGGRNSAAWAGLALGQARVIPQAATNSCPGSSVRTSCPV